MREALEDTLERMLCAVRGERQQARRVALTRIIIVRDVEQQVFGSVVARHRHTEMQWRR
jgi:hypothetical protein